MPSLFYCHFDLNIKERNKQMTIQEYIDKQYNGSITWFMEEVNQKNHVARIAGVVANMDYLAGRHKVLSREDCYYKGKVLRTRKTILNYAKTVLRFHDTFLLGKKVSLSSMDNNTVNTFNDIYRLGQYETVDYQILDRVNKFGDAYEVVYIDNGVIKSKVLDSACSYPVYDDMGEYLAFIEHWTDVFTSITYWNVYYPTYVEHWSNEGADEHLVSTTMAIGLPIHYHNFSDEDYNYGVSMLTDIKPIMDELEDVMSKMGDAIYVNSLNPMNVAIGQRIESSIPADAVGYVLNLDAGDYKVVSASMDYNTIKLYLDNLKQMLNDISCIPSVLGSSTNIANVSSVAMQILYAMAQVNADETKKWLNIGFRERFERFKKILSMQGISVESDVDVIYNVSMPVATTEMIANLKALQEMGAISTETIMEKSDIVSDVEVEKKRLSGENVSQDVSQKVDNPSEEVGIK
nr:MAG: portal protein [Bacteriophage sp.]